MISSTFKSRMSMLTPINYHLQLLIKSISNELPNNTILMRQQSQKRRKLFNKHPFNQLTEVYSISCHPYHPKSSSSTLDEQSFNYEYLQFMSENPLYQQLKEKIKYLYCLYCAVCDKGGLIEAVSQRKFDEILGIVAEKIPALGKYTENMIFEHYKLYLFDFQVVMKLNTRVSGTLLSNFGYPKIISAKQITQKSDHLIFEEDITIIKDFCQYVGVRLELAKIQKLSSFYRTLKTQVSVDHKLREISKGLYKGDERKKNQLTLQEFSDHIFANNNYLNQEFDQSVNQSQKIISCFNFDPQDDYLEQQVFGEISNHPLGFKGQNDYLSYCDEDIPGITIPIFNILTKSSWDGPKQTSIGTVKIDINFGNGEAMWYCVPHRYIQKLRNILITEYDFDIMKIEGQWWVDVDWILSNGINVKMIKQKTGEAVVIGPGCLYWYESENISTHSTWNMMPKTLSQSKILVSKLENLKELRMKQRVPVKSIFLRALNHETLVCQMTDNQQSNLDFMKKSLQQWLRTEQKFRNQLIIKCRVGSKRFQQYKLYDCEAYCVQCHQEILQYFIQSLSNMDPGISCLECFKNDLLKNQKQLRGATIESRQLFEKKIQKKSEVLYYRYDQYTLCQLIQSGIKHRNVGPTQQKCLELQIFEKQFGILCSGQYVGKVINCNKNSKKQEVFRETEEDDAKFQVITDKNTLDSELGLIQSEEQSIKRNFLDRLITFEPQENQVANKNLSPFKYKPISFNKGIDAMIQTQIPLMPFSEQETSANQPINSTSKDKFFKVKVQSEDMDLQEERTVPTQPTNQDFNMVLKKLKEQSAEKKTQRRKQPKKERREYSVEKINKKAKQEMWSEQVTPKNSSYYKTLKKKKKYASPKICNFDLY